MKVKVVPNARVFKAAWENGSAKVWVDAPAEGGRANKRLLEGLSKLFGRKVALVKGFRSREKEISVEGLGDAKVAQEIVSLSNRKTGV